MTVDRKDLETKLEIVTKAMNSSAWGVKYHEGELAAERVRNALYTEKAAELRAALEALPPVEAT